MPNRLSHITPLLAAVPAAVIANAPTAAANADPPSCAGLGGSATQCQMPGNVQINDAPCSCSPRASMERQVWGRPNTADVSTVMQVTAIPIGPDA